MKTAKMILITFAILCGLFVGVVFIVHGEARDAYRAGYEQCAQDTSLYLQIHPGYAGIPQEMRWWLIRKKPSPQNEEDMTRLILAYEKNETPGWHTYWLR